MLTKKFDEPLDGVVGVPDCHDFVVWNHIRSHPPDYSGDELIAVVLVRLANAYGEVSLVNCVFAVRLGKVLALYNGIGHHSYATRSLAPAECDRYDRCNYCSR